MFNEHWYCKARKLQNFKRVKWTANEGENRKLKRKLKFEYYEQPNGNKMTTSKI